MKGWVGGWGGEDGWRFGRDPVDELLDAFHAVHHRLGLREAAVGEGGWVGG